MGLQIDDVNPYKWVENMLIHLKDASSQDPYLESILAILLLLLREHLIICEQWGLLKYLIDASGLGTNHGHHSIESRPQLPFYIFIVKCNFH